MRETITMQRVRDACENVNRRMARHGSRVRYTVEQRCGYCALDPTRVGDPVGTASGDALIIGTKREVWEYLRAMMRALDDSEV